MEDMIEIKSDNIDDNIDDGVFDVTSQFKEKNWGKDENGLKVVDGYSFRGKQTFLKVVEGFKNIMKKGIENDFNGIMFKALDTRKQGNGLEIDIEITDKNDRGKAVMKLYGPSSKKKENVVMITKYKESDSKYVEKLTENIVRPMIKRMRNQTETKISIKKSVSTKLKKQKTLKCPFCDVTSHSSPGLKGHMTKKHQNTKQDNTMTVQDDTDNNSSELINSLLDEVIDIVDSENSKELSLEENCETEVGRFKKYKNKCEDCHYCVESDKKYAVVQTMLKHKREACNKQRSTEIKCDKCDFKTYDTRSLKRHMRDIHEMTTASTSPPPKRKRKTVIQIDDDKMDIDGKEYEEMDIDDQSKAEKDIYKERSDMNDRKILEKAKIEEDKAHERVKEQKGKPSKAMDKKQPDYQKEVKKLMNDKQKIEGEYYKCVNELALKTEECEKLKIELSDLKQLFQLKTETENLESNTTQMVKNIEVQNLQNKTDTEQKNENPWQEVSYKSKKRQHSHVNSKPEIAIEEEEYNCDECPFQGTAQVQLEKHIKLKHRITCRICEESFKLKTDMMAHRKLRHPNLVATCRNYKESKCPFEDSKCWWNHNLSRGNQEFKCFVCEEKFENKPSMMSHRKKKHPEIIRKCFNYEENKCRFQDAFCWFKHEISQQKEEQRNGQSSVFQKVSGNLKPPISAQRSAPRIL